MKPAPAGRLYFLDGLRIGAFGLLIAYHVGMYYVAGWSFHVKSPDPVPGLVPWMRLSEPWRMSLIFLISGAATAGLFRRGLTGRVLLRRTRFLLLPLLTGVVLVVPPQTYFEVVQKFGYDGGFPAFLGLYFSHHGGFCDGSKCLVMPTWNHLWFLPYLWVYTVVLYLALTLCPTFARAVASVLASMLGGAGLWLVPMLWFALCRIVLLPRYPQTHALLDDVYAHALYGFAFGLGALFMRMDGIWDRLGNTRLPALAVALCAWAVLVLVRPPWPQEAMTVAVFQWSALTALLGLAVRHLDRDWPGRTMLTEAVYPVYIVHQTVLILLSQALRGWHMSTATEALFLTGLTGAISYGFYRFIRGQALLRPWFGLRV